MNFTDNFIPKKTPKLIGYDAKFQFFKDLEVKKRMPKVLLLSGEKGLENLLLLTIICIFSAIIKIMI